MFSAVALLMALNLLPVAPASAKTTQSVTGIPDALMSKMTKGVNINKWFDSVVPTDTEHFGSYLVDADFQEFKNLGVQFVRLCVSPDVIYQNGEPNQTNLPFLDKAVDRFAAANMAVVVDLNDYGQLKLDEAGHDTTGFVHFWQSMATHYKGKQEASLVFELLNSPVFLKNSEVWYKLQKQTVSAIRAIDPERTLVVASSGWDNVESLLLMKPLEAKNLFYSFHFYDPFIFTHQGSSFNGDQESALHDIPFPSSPKAVAEILNSAPEKDKTAVREYGKERWNGVNLEAHLAVPVKWARKHHVALLLGEFGAIPPKTPSDSRANWFDVMRGACSHFGLSFALRGYDDPQGLNRILSEDGTVHVDPVAALHVFNVKG